jgi:hypothetical protein
MDHCSPHWLRIGEFRPLSYLNNFESINKKIWLDFLKILLMRNYNLLELKSEKKPD